MDPGLKKRLLGAVVLIALAVIFVPMLLPRGSGSDSQSVSLKIPPQPSGELQTRILQVGPNGASAGSSTAAAAADPDHVATLDLEKQAPAPTSEPGQPSIEATTVPVAPASAPAAGAGKPATTSAPVAPADIAKSSPPASTPQAAPAGPIPGGPGAAAKAIYTVNLGIYADHASAARLVAQAKQQGFTALATPETFQGKRVSRVRVGPFSSRAQAEAARLKLKDVEHVPMRVDASVMNQAGDAPSSAIAAGQPGAWAVQLGAFSVESQATALRGRLRSQGFDGYVDSVDTSGGKLWRVRAGPFASRGVAATMRDRIEQKLQVKGNIVTQD